ncbi:MAG TPA: DUF2844 domain-containing protein [Steroidobacteraceae bacterium]
MTHTRRVRTVLGTAVAATLLAGSVTLPAFAALGGDAASVDTDVARMKGQARATAVAGYTVQEITLPSGTVVREYVSAEGKVFAVTWRGMSQPDLQQTLGTYFEQYKAAASAPHAGHHHLTIHQPELILSSGGHMRAWSGKAYVPALLPPNFSVDDIR